MRDLGSRDLRGLVAVAQLVAEARSSAELSEQAIASMQHLLGATSSVYIECRNRGRAARFHGVATHDAPELALQNWTRRYQVIDPVVSHYLTNGCREDRHVLLSNEIMREQEFERTVFYNEFLRPISIHHVMLVGVARHGEPLAILGFHRPQSAPAFSRRDVQLAEASLPFFRNAAQRFLAAERFDEQAWMIEKLADEATGDGVLILDGNFEPLYASSGAEALLSETVLNAGRTPIPAAIVQACRRLKAQKPGRSERVGETTDSAEVEMTTPRGRRKARISLRQRDGHGEALRFVVCFERFDRPLIEDARMRAIGLSAREREIAQLVGIGLTNANIAARLCISVRTVENHLRSIYDKARVNNRTALVYCLQERH